MQRFIVVIFLISLISCNNGSDNSKIIQNDSDKEIKMLIFNGGFPRGDTLVLSPGTQETFSIGESNDVSAEELDCTERIDSAQVSIEGGGILTKEIQRNSNWEVETERTSVVPNRYEHTCTFTITNADIDE